MSQWLVDTAMDLAKRHQLVGKLLDGYVSGPAASTEATPSTAVCTWLGHLVGSRFLARYAPPRSLPPRAGIAEP